MPAQPCGAITVGEAGSGGVCLLAGDAVPVSVQTWTIAGITHVEWCGSGCARLSTICVVCVLFLVVLVVRGSNGGWCNDGRWRRLLFCSDGRGRW